jgi:hypothetical protein
VAAILGATPTAPLLLFFSAFTFSNLPKLNKQLLPQKICATGAKYQLQLMHSVQLKVLKSHKAITKNVL